jgi:hypothetical protein
LLSPFAIARQGNAHSFEFRTGGGDSGLTAELLQRMWVQALRTAKGPLFCRTAFMRDNVLEVSLGAGTVLLHCNDLAVAFVASHVFALQSETLLNVDLLPLQCVPDFANLYQHLHVSEIDDALLQYEHDVLHQAGNRVVGLRRIGEDE